MADIDAGVFAKEMKIFSAVCIFSIFSSCSTPMDVSHDAVLNVFQVDETNMDFLHFCKKRSSHMIGSRIDSRYWNFESRRDAINRAHNEAYRMGANAFSVTRITDKYKMYTACAAYFDIYDCDVKLLREYIKNKSK